MRRWRNRSNYVPTEEVQLNILCYAEENSLSSLTMTSNYFGISRSSIGKVLKQFKYNSYKFTNHQQLSPEDQIKRTDFRETLFNLKTNNENIKT